MCVLSQRTVVVRYGLVAPPDEGRGQGDDQSEPPTLLHAISSDDGDRPNARLKSPSPLETVSFRLAADWVRLCRERRECNPPDSMPCNREQGSASVVHSAGLHGPTAHVGNFLGSVNPLAFLESK